MAIDTFTLRLIFLLIPGLISVGLINSLGQERERKIFTIIAQVFVYGLLSYAFLALIMYFCSAANMPTIFHSDFLKKANPINFIEIFYASLISVFIGIIVVINVNYSLLLRLLQKLRITQRFGDVDVWGYVFNSASLEAWVTVRRPEDDVVYDGYVEVFSGGSHGRELLLSQALVYDAKTGKKIDDIPMVYLSFAKDDVLLEFRGTKAS